MTHYNYIINKMELDIDDIRKRNITLDNMLPNKQIYTSTCN